MDIVIVDDEQLARERLGRMIKAMPGYRVADEAADGTSALACVRDAAPDIVLLDIHMPGTDGLQVAAELAALPLPPAVIFTTAYSEHALSAHRLAASGYLLKPIKQPELTDALSRARRPSRAQLQALRDARAGAEPRFVTAHSRDGHKRIALDEVIYFRAEHKYTVVYHMHGELLIDESLSTLERRFGDAFVRIHRKALVARRLITDLYMDNDGHRKIRLRHCDRPLPVSRRRAADVRHVLTTDCRDS